MIIYVINKHNIGKTYMEQDPIFINVTKEQLLGFKETSISMNIVYNLFETLKKSNITYDDVCRDLGYKQSYLTQLRSGSRIVSIKFLAKVISFYKIELPITIY